MRDALLSAGFLLMAVAAAAGQSPPAGSDEIDGFVFWPHDQVEAIADRLQGSIGDRAMVYETIRNEDGHSVYFVLRGQTGRAELHETEADLYIVHRGRATFVIGGELTDAESLPRKQQRGTTIQGGRRHLLEPGDIIHVPMATPHHLVIEPGERFLYTLVKFDEEPLAVTRP